MGTVISACGDVIHHNGSVALPQPIVAALMQFLLDKRKGNAILHIKDGKILGITFEDKSLSTIVS